MSHATRKPAFCFGENKNADQLLYVVTAQLISDNFFLLNTDSIISVLFKSENSKLLKPSSMTV